MMAIGEARLRFARRGSGTVLADSYTVAPLQVRGPLIGAPPGTARIALMAIGGGLLADGARVEMQLDQGTAAQVGGVGATRVLPATDHSWLDTRVRLAPESSLALLPDPLIPCAGAAYRQHTTISIEPGAHAVIGEVIAPGRMHHGESFAYRSLDMRLQVECAGRLLLMDRLILEPAAGHLPAMLGLHTHLASIVFLGPYATADLARRLHGSLTREGLAGGATLAGDGVVLARMLGHEAYGLHMLVRELIGRAARLGFPVQP